MTPSASKKGDLLQWERSKDLPWGLLILFGGGLSLAAQISSSGLGIWIGYSLLILKPKDLSENLTKMAYTIPNVKQGKQTTQYLEKNRKTKE